MNFWVIADTHFGHDAIKKYCERPDDCDRRTLENIEKMVPSDSALIHLGDVCIGDDAEWHSMMDLPSISWLIRGNHDRKSNSWYLKWWDVVADRIDLKIYGQHIVFTHAPIPVEEGQLNIHGHLHNTGHREAINDGRHLLVTLEHDYKPYKLQRLVEQHQNSLRKAGTS